MTTLLGIVARNGRQGIVLATDIMTTQRGWADHGEVRVRVAEQNSGTKVYVNKERGAAIAAAGLYDSAFLNLMRDFGEGNVEIDKAIERGKLEEFERIHLARAGGKMIEPDATNSLLIASRHQGDPKLYSCWPFGKIDPVEQAIALGSGCDHAMGYLREILSGTVPRDVKLSDAIEHARRAISLAGRDMYTKGLTITVITNDGIDAYGDSIQGTLDKALDGEISRIRKVYK